MRQIAPRQMRPAQFLLDLGRIEVGVGLQLETIPLFDIVERVTSTLQPQAAQKNIQLTTQVPEGRAPLIEAVHASAQVLAKLPDGRIVAARQGRWLATSFHPELTLDDRFHRYFLTLAG